MDRLIYCRQPTPTELAYIKENLYYNAETGIIKRKDRKNADGSYDKDGYKIIKIKGRQYKAHRLAWYLYYGNFPTVELDHKNRNKADNRITNLRESNRQQQNFNKEMICRNATGYIGITKDRTKGLKKIYAIKSMGKTYRFYTMQEAIKFKNELLKNVL